MIEAVQMLLEWPFLQRALLAAVLMAILCGVLGTLLVLRGFALLGEGIAHIGFAGVALGLVLAFYEIWMALIFAVVGALLIQFLFQKGIAKSDASIGIVFTTALAFGVALVSYHKGFNADIHSILFGNLLAVGRQEIQFILIIGVALLGVVGFLYKELFYVTFSEEAARLSGVPVSFLNAAFMALTAASIVMAAQIVGILLVSALIIIPASTSLLFARSFRGAILLSVAFGVLSVIVGVLAAVEWGLATGASVTLAAAAFFAVSALVTKTAPAVKRVLTPSAGGARDRR
jgi:zinc transport system permease protein